MTAALAAGAAPTTALSLVAEVVDEAMADGAAQLDDPARARHRPGRPSGRRWPGIPSSAGWGSTLHRSAESGAPVAAALLRLSEDLRARRRAAVEERVRQVEVRAAVPLGVCLLPSFVLVGVVPLVAGSVTGLLLVR